MFYFDCQVKVEEKISSPLLRDANFQDTAIAKRDPDDDAILPVRQKRAMAITTVKPTTFKSTAHTTLFLLKDVSRQYIVVAGSEILHNIETNAVIANVDMVIAMESSSFTADRRAEFVYGIAAALHVPARNVIIDKIMESDVIIEFYVIKPHVTQSTFHLDANSNLSKILYPAKDVVEKLTPSVLRTYLSEFKVTDVHPKYKFNNGPKEHELTIWNQYWFIGAMVGTAACLILLGIFVATALWRRYKFRKQEIEHRDFEKQLPLLLPGHSPLGNSEQRYIQPWDDPSVVENDWLQVSQYQSHPRSLAARRNVPRLPLPLGANVIKPVNPSPPRDEIFQRKSRVLDRQELQEALDNVSRIHAEFAEIPMNFCDQRIAGTGKKNRHQQILPNLRTLVNLPEIPNVPLSNYINANYVRGYKNEPRAFIATQGPLPNTIDDFWRMAWFQNVSLIIMITKVREKNLNKCEYYWPNSDQGQVTYGEIKVTLENICEREGYIVSQLKLENTKITESPRYVYHFWYTSWPDHGAPDSARQLLQLVKEVRVKRQELSTGPIVVHCSAGIGRTGCFIAISIGIIQYEMERVVDILNIVSSMREDRGGLVQTLEQYEFVYKAMYLFSREYDNNRSRPLVLGNTLN
ncbi:Receptor-type tyrosine-protein phosphatase R [Trichoplax sp. H2]|nr:Receptor-type tyrosine-protein phosphatase R [Trichoplax sp. H2]|eukprot:RDD42874.1 Receptor-type tyrosine-protein phosphatase R [Trichoplax sp. H2]